MKFLRNTTFGSHWASGLLLTVMCLIISCSSPDDDMDPGNNQNADPDQMDDEGGEAAPGFELQALDGSKVKLADYENKVVVLFFMGHSCTLCKAVAPSVQKELKEGFAGKADYVILGLDTWDGNSSTMQAFKDVTGITFPLLLQASAVAKDYSTTYDRLVVIDKKGKIAHSGSRATTNDLSTVKAKVEELLNGK